MAEVIAILERLYIYPVKSMAGIAVTEAHVGLDGIIGDRQCAFVQAEKKSFPWMTARENPRMLLYKPRFETMPTPENPEPPLRIETPDGRVTEISDASLRMEVAGGRQVFLMRCNRGMFDCQHLSLFSLASVQKLGEEAESGIDHRQFRANLYATPSTGRPFEEEQWSHCLLQIGDRVLASVAQRDTRCMMTNLNPETGEQNPKVLRTIAQLHGGDAGLYLTVIRTGVIRRGDAIRRIPLPE